ncbi:MAG: hypothetical protein RLZZ458_49, partial [Planctomycetota bacterium]
MKRNGTNPAVPQDRGRPARSILLLSPP